MTGLAWVFVRGVTSPAVLTALTVTSITSGLLLWVTCRTHAHTDASTRRMHRQMVNLAGEVRALRDESECRWLTQQAWPAHRATLSDLLKPPEDANRK